MRYFDLHCDTVSLCRNKGIMPNDISLAVSTKKGVAFDVWYQCYALFASDNSSDPKGDYFALLQYFNNNFSNLLRPVPILTLENGILIDSLEFVDRLAADKIKAVTLTWNGENKLAGGAYSGAGLKPFGKQVIQRMNAKKIACDLSHLNRKSFFEAGETAYIVFASHSCCDKTHRHQRNLSDEQIKYIHERGGIIGLCFYPVFLGTKYAFEGVWRHINHMLNMGLENNICIGSDFDGADMAECLDGVDKIPDLYNFLLSCGLGSKLLDKIFFENAQKFFEKF